MNHALLAILIIALVSLTAPAQTPNTKEWTSQKKTQREYLMQQVAALKVYTRYLKKGYDIVNKGLTAIGDIKNGTFNLDQDYFNSLRNVSPVIRKSPKVKEILEYQHAMNEAFRVFIPQCKKDDHLTSEEVTYIEAVCQHLRNEAHAALDELTRITTAGESEMTDDARLKRLDAIHAKVEEHYTFSRSFIDGVTVLCRQRSREKQDIHLVEKLHEQP